MMRINIYKFILCQSFFLVFGCASIPKQAPLLSEEIGQRVNSIEQSHLNLLHIFFDEKRKEVDQFLTNIWIPHFANNLFNNQTVENAWNEIVTDGDKVERLKFIVLMGTRLQNQINEKRLELIAPLDNLENTIEGQIRANYNDILSANNSLTSYLYSASKVEENRERYLSMVGITEYKINNTLTNIDDFVSNLAAKGETVLNKEEQVEKYLKNLKDLNNKLTKIQ